MYALWLRQVVLLTFAQVYTALGLEINLLELRQNYT